LLGLSEKYSLALKIAWWYIKVNILKNILAGLPPSGNEEQVK
jgi:hypothetical protein